MGNDAKNKDRRSRAAQHSSRHAISPRPQERCNPSASSSFVLFRSLTSCASIFPASASTSSARSLYINEFAILFLTMMFVWILVAAMAMIYGRFWCGYLCPQMIFSEAANGLEKRINRMVNRKFLEPRTRRAARSFHCPVLRRSAAWVHLLHLRLRLVFRPARRPVPSPDHLDMRTAGGITGASVTLITVLDFAFFRTRFCTAICPYGYLQNMLADKHTLLVHFQEDSSGKCILCQKCVRACPMGIDIRKLVAPAGVHALRRMHRCLLGGPGQAGPRVDDSLRVG
jgi:polyferredoxin